ncbi:hypothetical protein [Streptomyces sp. NPDC004783]|uniref:hypothetical protein n=1 Tax=Streptomyces sp. NPDC004783 TaxID=3154459 RepID=UPI0033A97B34
MPAVQDGLWTGIDAISSFRFVCLADLPGSAPVLPTAMTTTVTALPTAKQVRALAAFATDQTQETSAKNAEAVRRTSFARVYSGSCVRCQ